MGDNANCGVWARTDEAYGFLYEYLTVDEFKWLCPDMAEYEVERYDMPNLRAMNRKRVGNCAGTLSKVQYFTQIEFLNFSTGSARHFIQTLQSLGPVLFGKTVIVQKILHLLKS